MDKTMMDSRHYSPGIKNDDPFEAIFALNMGEFVTEHLISNDLLDKINHTVANPDKVRKQLAELIEIYSLGNTLSLLGFNSSQEFVLYDSLAMSLVEMFQVDRCHVFQTVTKDDVEQFLSLTGTSLHGVPSTRWHLGYDLQDTEQMVVESYFEGYPLALSDVNAAGTYWKPISELHQAETQAVMAVPLTEGQKRMGLLLFESLEPHEFSQEMIDLAEAIAKVFVISHHLQRLLDKAKQLISMDAPPVSEMLGLRAQLTESIADLGRTQQFFMEALAYAIDSRHEFSQGHSQDVAQTAKAIAEAMMLNEKTIDLVYYAGLLGSLGKIHIPSDILTKADALTPEERDILRQSPNIGIGFLMKMNFLAEVIPYLDYQKERWNGQDSPHGLSGRSIPLGARIIAVADAYEALIQERPYRAQGAMTPQEALNVLQSEAGTKWDPDIVSQLAKIRASAS